MATNDNRPGDLDFGATLRGFTAGQKLFNRYTLEKILGRGGMGVVWLARDEHLTREVALKFLPEIVTADRMALDELKRETLKGLQLNHHHIVRIYDFLQHDAWAGISMEYVDGDNLSNLRLEKENRLFEAEELQTWVRQLCEALEYAHTKPRLVHRDLKPANLMVNSAGELKVADFGISSSISESASRVSQRMNTCGTLVYMSPQQVDGEPARVTDDIYSLGATLYDLLTTKPPFYQGNIDRQLREKIPSSMAQRRADLEIGGGPIPENWEQTIAACLEKDHAKRPQSAGEVAYRLGLVESYAAQPKVELPKAEVIRVEHQPKPGAKRGNGALIAVLVLLLGCGAFAGWWLGIEQPKREAEEKLQAQQTRAQQLADAAAAEKQKEQDAAKAKADEAAAALEKQKQEEAQALKDYLDGMDYLYGNNAKGVLIDETKGAGLIQKAAEEGLPEAEAELAYILNGYILLYGHNVLPDDGEKAQEWAKKALDHGLESKAQEGGVYAELELGNLCDNHLGMSRNVAKARALYQEAADQGMSRAQNSLGFLYESGADVPQDYAKAAELYQKAAGQGDANAQRDLGWLYENGYGVNKNIRKAKELYQAAAESGNKMAKGNLDSLNASAH